MVPATLSVALAVPPIPGAATKLLSVMPVTAELVITALVTTPSGSVALTPTNPGAPSVVFNGVGQEVLIG